jgi:hypothetical protein
MSNDVHRLYEQVDELNDQINEIADRRRQRINQIEARTFTFGVRDRDLEDDELTSAELYARKRGLLAKIEHGRGGDQGFSSRAIPRCERPGCGRLVYAAGNCRFHYQQKLSHSRSAAESHRPWSADEDQIIRRMNASGYAVNEIALALGRNAGHVRYRMTAIAEWAARTAGSEDANAAG